MTKTLHATAPAEMLARIDDAIQSLDREVAADEAGLPALAIDGPAYESAYLALSARRSRLNALNASRVPAEAALADARLADERDEVLAARERLQRRDESEAKDHAQLESLLAKVADVGERRKKTGAEIHVLNDAIRRLGRCATVVDGVTRETRHPGFDDLQRACPGGLAHPEIFFGELRIPAIRAGTPPLWKGRQ